MAAAGTRTRSVSRSIARREGRRTFRFSGISVPVMEASSGIFFFEFFQIDQIIFRGHVLQPLFDGEQQIGQLVPFLATKAAQFLFHHGFGNRGDVPVDTSPQFGQKHPFDAAVGLVLAAFDPAECLQLVDQTPGGGLLDFQQFREFGLVDTRLITDAA